MSDYRSGYGQCKADTIQEICRAIDLCYRSLTDPMVEPDEVKLVRLRARLDALIWVRAMVKAQECPRLTERNPPK